MKDILYINTVEDIRLIDTLNISDKEKELPNQIILTILSAGTGTVTPIFSKEALGNIIFSSIDEIGTKFILDDKEITSDDFLVITKSQYGINYNFFGLLFEDSNEHTLKISLINSKIPNFQRITFGPGYSANSITSVVISNSITEIDEYTFYGCTGLTSVTLGNSVTKIGDWAFRLCSSLISITISSSITIISLGTFSDCTSLTSITIPNSVISIGSSAFDSCTNLTSITIPNSVEEIGPSAFARCGLTSVTIPNSVTSISSSCFASCTDLTSITIPNSVTEIGIAAFASCTGLTSIVIPDSVTDIGNRAFDNCNGITSLTWNAINCPSNGNMTTTNIEQLSIGNEVQILPDNFVIDSKITSVTIPNSVNSIGIFAFASCKGLTSVAIPNSITTIGDRAFAGCSNLASITSLTTTAPTITNATFQNVKTNGTLHVPAGSDYSTWMSVDNYYLGSYNWTKVEDVL